jgi:4-amino-4-deoxy-L-arabinose transferase-like glycosyltransferase
MIGFIAASQSISVNAPPAESRNVPTALAAPVVMRTGAGTLAAVALLALAAAIAYLWLAGPARYKDIFEEPKIATHIASGHGFLTPLDDAPSAIPTSWCAPIYPYVMAGAYRAFGIETTASLNAMLALNALCHAAVAVAACVLGTWLFSRATGLIAGIVVALHPVFLFRTIFYWDTLLALAIFVWLVVAAVWIRKNGVTVPRMILFGAGLGILALTNAAYAFTFPLLVLLAAWGRCWVGRFKSAAVALVVFLIVITPWTIRNYHTFGKIFFIRGGVNMEMWLANQPLSYGWVIAVNHPRMSPVQREQMLAMGENAYYELCGRRFSDDYRAAPSNFRWRSWNRFVYLFFGDPKEEGAVRSIFHWHGYALDKIAINAPLLVLGLAGAWTARRLGYRTGWVLLLALLAGAPFILTYISYRYVMPTRLMLVLPASFLLAATWERLRTGNWREAEASFASVV